MCAVLLQAPQLALLHHNDLRHLADVLLILPTAYGPQLDPLLSKTPQQTGGDVNLGVDVKSAASGEDRASGGGGRRLGFLEDALLLRQAAEELLSQQVPDGTMGPR